MLRGRYEANFLKILSQTNIEISEFIAIYIILESVSLHIFLFLKWKMTAENALMLSLVMYVLVYESVCLYSHILTYVSNFMFGHVLVFRNTTKESQSKVQQGLCQKHLGKFKHTYTHFDTCICKRKCSGNISHPNLFLKSLYITLEAQIWCYVQLNSSM